MVHLLIIVLGIAAFYWTDANSESAFFSFVLPLAFFVSVLYAMLLGVYLIQRKGLNRARRPSEDLRFWTHMNSGMIGEHDKKNYEDHGTEP